ncbi:putative protein YOR389W OS=Saccharomyces cerevisiae (strain ATCC 204508 / S288c) GN=YOR389W PE=2 SV=1 [Rhizoctonia solani AG-1 IB]|uniref:Uncharacterized protein n=1 Tax=Thanatephorus cucumeris (strain AG1-IB / isolate 7/3/14) TaxID=1108050 RepID=A0A0B7FHN6_THACB|nr:putative protein YOR389W OS=Saccharomyces cerevisiae (strain ATCC 204508 / S288c) GN=YOR389W PE=2 SV=1 [Rhizoctonia solani AG-1 IB]
MGFRELLVCLLVGSGLVSGRVIPGASAQKSFVLSQAFDSRPSGGGRAWDSPTSDDNYDNQIFFRLATLLQHWSNTRYPSGSSIIPGTVPVGTALYHGRSDAEIPSTPEWLAFDPEHSALFSRGSNGHLFTFITTRSLRVVYFDGSSAAKLTSGATDTQNLLAWGHIRNQTFSEERALIHDLCEWGKDFGIDGYVRMEMSFEIMYCDFHQGIKVVSSAHILPPDAGDMPDGPPGKGPGGPPPPNELDTPNHPPTSPPTRPRFPKAPRPPNWKGALTSMKARSFEAFQAGAWHRRAPGEVRVRLDAARLVTLYDPALRSGARIRNGLEKVQHRGKGLSQEDINTLRAWVTDSVRPDAPATSGVDWQALTTVIMDRYGSRLEYLRFLLNPDHVSANATAIVQQVRAQLMIILMPDLTQDTIPSNATLTSSSAAAQYSQIRRREARNNDWVKPIFDHCSSYLVSHLPYETFTREERTLYSGVRGTLHETCRVLSLLWSEAYDPLPEIRPMDLVNRWRAQVNELMQWLDWPMWNKCAPECDLDSICFIPTWPKGIGRGPVGKGEDDLTKVDWTPKCLPKGGAEW